MSPFSFLRRHLPADDLSAYVDNELPPARMHRVETHVAACKQCWLTMLELRDASAFLREVPEAVAPRSFALTAQQAAAPVTRSHDPARAPASSGGQGLVFGMRIATAGVAAALALAVALDVGSVVEDGGADRENTALNMAADSGLQLESTAPSPADEERASDLPAAATGVPDEATEDGASRGASGGTTTGQAPGGGTGGGGTTSGGGVGGVGGAPSPTTAGGDTGALAPSPTVIEPDMAVGPEGTAASPLDDFAAVAPESSADADEVAFDVDAGGDDGTNTLLIIEIVLGVLLAGTLAASVVVSRMNRS